MTDVANLLVDSDYPLDKIIYMTSGSFTVAGGGGAGTTDVVAHGLSFTPLICGNWSNTSNFANTKEMAIYAYGDTDGMQAYVYSDATNITVSSINYGSTSKTCYWRVYGFMPISDNDDADFTASQADSFAFSTDYNYTKLNTSLSGYYDASAGSVTITHDFGYRPQVIAWRADDPSFIFQQNVAGYVKVSTTTIVLTGGSGEKYHIRIYMDAQV